jgi:hypothetical protein
MSASHGLSGVQFSLRLILIVTAAFGVVLAVAVGPVQSACDAARQMSAMNNAKQIVLAIHNYSEQNQSLPRAVTYTADGQAAYSWRFVLLPFMEQIGLREDEEGRISTHPFHHVDIGKAWDDPVNLAAANMTIPMYQRPGERNRVAAATNFVIVTGPGTLFPDDGSARLADIQDDFATTIVLVEISDSDIPWYEPRDLHIDRMSFRINDPDARQPCIGNRRLRGAIVGGEKVEF